MFHLSIRRTQKPRIFLVCNDDFQSKTTFGDGWKNLDENQVKYTKFFFVVETDICYLTIFFIVLQKFLNGSRKLKH